MNFPQSPAFRPLPTPAETGVALFSQNKQGLRGQQPLTPVSIHISIHLRQQPFLPTKEDFATLGEKAQPASSGYMPRFIAQQLQYAPQLTSKRTLWLTCQADSGSDVMACQGPMPGRRKALEPEHHRASLQGQAGNRHSSP